MDGIDVLCVGQASYDLVFSVKNHPGPDEKSIASRFTGCGGGPAANAAVTVARLGYRAAFGGYLGNDFYGQAHFEELARENVSTRYVYRGKAATPLSVILVKPDGKRTVVNYRDPAIPPPADAELSVIDLRPGAILFDGHEPHLSQFFMDYARKAGIATILDAGSVHAGTCNLAGQVDYLVASQKFSKDFTGEIEIDRALQKLSRIAPAVVVTLGEDGIAWQRSGDSGKLDAFAVKAVDTTGAGDAFHGAFAAGIAKRMDWPMLLRYASAVGALTCTGFGARPAIPDADTVERFLKQGNFVFSL